jgi:hypothetical protein
MQKTHFISSAKTGVLIQYEETPVIDVYPYVKPINATKIESF